MVRDPVCGVRIAEQDAHASRYIGGLRVYFCSAACVHQFDAEPQRFYPLLGGSPTFQVESVSRPTRPIQASITAGPSRALLRPAVFGLLASLGLLAFYLGIITLAQGWGHALGQLADDRWFVGAIALGFGLQVGLFTYLRGLHAHAMAGGVAASTGTSATAMLACCAHHLADIVPIVGVAGAAALLNTYKIPMLWLGIIMNLAGAAYLAHQINRQRRIAYYTNTAVG